MTEESKALVKAKEQGVEAVVNKLFSTKTPTSQIKSRPGPKGMVLKYVTIGYVTNELNKAFGPYWEFRVVDKQIGKKQVWVQGQLTIKDPKSGLTITKETFGGADIKISTSTGEPIDIANDLKSAVSDCTKKCASMFGIAADVFFKEQDQYEQLGTLVDTSDTDESTKRIVMNKFFAVAAQKGFTAEKAKEIIKTKYKVAHMEDLSTIQMEEAIKSLEVRYQDVEVGEEPLEVGKYRLKPEFQVLDPVGAIGEDYLNPDNAKIENPEEVDDIKLDKECRQCSKVVPEGNVPEWFCDKACQDKYWEASGAQRV